MQDKFDVKLIVKNEMWGQDPSFGFLTPTVLTGELPGNKRVVYGAVRDNFGQAVIRRVEISNELDVSIQRKICFDRRNSTAFDTNGTILGHVANSGEVIRLYYVGFRHSKRVKFEALSGLAESNNGGITFKFKQMILDRNAFTFLNGSVPDIVACHWNNLDVDGNGKALVAIGNGWIEKESNTYPKYSSYLIEVENFQFKSLICQVPQKNDIYRLGRPRFLEGQEMKRAVLTGGKISGDYRPYFFDYDGHEFVECLDLQFPIQPERNNLFKQQVSYPELIQFVNPDKTIFLFNGDSMGMNGCYCLTSKGWWQ